MDHYPVPASSGVTFDTWRPIEQDETLANEHQKRLMAAVEQALDSGLFYNTDVYDFVCQQLGDYVREEDKLIELGRVERGVFGCEIYMARQCLEKAKARAKDAKYRAELDLQPGKKLGTLVFNDYKVTRAVTVEEVKGTRFVLTGSRGKYKCRIETNATAIKNAIERALERGNRKS